MRRSTLLVALPALTLGLLIGPAPVRAGGDRALLKPGPAGAVMERPIAQEFPSFLQAGSGIAPAPEDAGHGRPNLHQVPLTVQPGDIIVLKVRSSQFQQDPSFAPLAGPYKPRQAANHPTVYPYSLLPVPRDGVFRYQASYVTDFARPATLGFTNTDQIVMPDDTARRGRVHWDYRYGVTYRHDEHERRWAPHGFANDADQNPGTIDDSIGHMQWYWPLDGHFQERAFFYQSETNFDREDWMHFTTDGTGILHIDIELANGLWSTWSCAATVYNLAGRAVATADTKGNRLSLQVPFVPRDVENPKEEPSGTNYFRLQIVGQEKSKSSGSNVHYLPYRVRMVQISK